MSSYPLAGKPLPVWLIGSGDPNSPANLAGNTAIVVDLSGYVTLAELIKGRLADPSIAIIRPISAENAALTNAASVTPTVDKRGYSSVAFYVPSNFSGTTTKVRAQVSYNGAVWFYPRKLDSYLEEALVTGEALAFAFYDLFAYPFVRLVFLSATNVQQSQTNLAVKYSLVA